MKGLLELLYRQLNPSPDLIPPIRPPELQAKEFACSVPDGAVVPAVSRVSARHRSWGQCRHSRAIEINNLIPKPL